MPVLSVSIEPQRYLLERIAGPGWKVNTVLSKGADPENFDPAMSTLVRTAQSEVYFTIGAGAFEESLAERLAEASPGLRFSDSSAGVARLHGTHNCGGPIPTFMVMMKERVTPTRTYGLRWQT